MTTYRVLLVDDEVEIRDCLQILAGRAELVFEHADDGEEGLKLILKNDYDCVVSDIKMPRLNGVDMLKAVRGHGKDVPFVFISAFATDDFAHQVSDYGAVKLLHKLDILKVKDSIKEAIDLAQELREIHRSADPMGVEFIQMVNKTGIHKL